MQNMNAFTFIYILTFLTTFCGAFKCSTSNEAFNDSYVCDGKVDCYDDCSDELTCGINTKFYPCPNGCVALLPLSTCLKGVKCPRFCDGVSQCSDGSDELKLGFGFKCVVQTFIEQSANRCILPQFYIKRWESVNQPRETICAAGEDKACYDVTNDDVYFDYQQCWQCEDSTVIQRQQICDGVFDCQDLTDECLCEADDVTLNGVCDVILSNKHKCGLEEVPCMDLSHCINKTSICNGIIDCVDGWDEEDCERVIQTTERISNYECQGGYALDETVVACDGRPDCLHLDDECSRTCEDDPEYCNYFLPLVLRLKFSNSCIIHIDELCNGMDECYNGEDERHCPFLTPCSPNNITMGQYDHIFQKCDLILHCENGADELSCSNSTHFYCDDNTTIISVRRVYDGVFDCSDFTDECSFSDTSISSVTMMIKEPALRACVWIILAFALAGNVAVIIKTAREVWVILRGKSHSVNKLKLIHKTMVLNLSVGDVLMAFYLCIIASKDIEFSNEYCKHELKWLSSATCSVAGILSMISSQSTVLLMAMMTTYRLHGVLRPFRTEGVSIKFLLLVLLFIWTVSAMVAILPITPSLQRIFVSKYVLNQPFIKNSSITLTQMQDLVGRLNNLSNTKYLLDQYNPVGSFQSIFYKENHNHLSQTSTGVLGFYSSNSVCLPNLFGTYNDAWSSFTFTLVMVDLLLFIYLLVGYIIIYRATLPNEITRSCNTDADARVREDRVLWMRITSLIFTDFLCWVPICIMSLLSYRGVMLPGIVYRFAAIVLFPINSAFNPWLYSTVPVFPKLNFRSWFNKKRKVFRYSVKTDGQNIPAIQMTAIHQLQVPTSLHHQRNLKTQEFRVPQNNLTTIWSCFSVRPFTQGSTNDLVGSSICLSSYNRSADSATVATEI
uniref:uncharacterized protein LOC100179477 isoform X2 n=1 Tax=Ciona intestinalis TaxID=7719 RepID=UPI000EF4D313|nr:uncharacterized protein LOC100179477 isoform X2 [Ciona intestinalis]|eukprot:XP_026695686.1 uncharacterized protein LOC100179477 isoform X2 [Ciona intestinalis]